MTEIDKAAREAWSRKRQHTWPRDDLRNFYIKGFRAGAEWREGYSQKQIHAMVSALAQVSFYARINHGTKCKDYGEVVDPVLESIGVSTGELFTAAAPEPEQDG